MGISAEQLRLVQKRITSEVSQAADTEKVYAYLKDVTDLTEVQQKSTQESYSVNVDTYSEIEWSDQALGGMWNSVFDHLRTLLAALPEGEKNIAVPGMGSGRDLYFLTELVSDLHVYGSDLQAEMVNKAKKRLVWKDVLQLADFIQKKDPDQEYWIHALIRILNQFDVVLNKKDAHGNLVSVANSTRLQKQIIKLIQGRVHISQQDMRKLNYPENTFDVILNVGNFPHLTKTELLPTILSMVSKLKVGGTLSFDLKMDVELFEVAEAKGRVWQDTDIIGKRYFNTYTESEIVELGLQLEDLGLELKPEYKSAPHPNKLKPPFIRLSIVKPPDFKSPTPATESVA